jgi:hypothetical protein
MNYSVETALCGMIYIPSMMKTGATIQTILRYCLRNLSVCNVGITDEKDL